ncbi:MAG: cyclase family protein [Candidatus Obscuribacterales bacterium]|jgi:arylformamidase
MSSAELTDSMASTLSGNKLRIIDISQPVTSTSACFPGDVPFSKHMTLTYADSQIINLTALTMSPHVGTHADAPSHIGGDMDALDAMAGAMPLAPYIGECFVIDAAPFKKGLPSVLLEEKLTDMQRIPERILFRTQIVINYDVFEDEYAYFTVKLVEKAKQFGIRLLGIDTPSVDQTTSKTLETHHALEAGGMSWLENLDLTRVAEGRYFLVALPLKFMELEASPVRAVLLGTP